MSRKMFLLLVAMFTLAFFVNAEENVEEENNAEAEEVAPGNKAEEKAEIKEINAEEKAKEAEADADIKDEGQKEEAKEIAEDKAAGKEEAKIETVIAKDEAAKLADEPVKGQKKSGSWFSWLWPFGSSEEKKVDAEKAAPAEPAPVVEAAPVAAEAAAPAEPKVDEKAGQEGEKSSVGRAILLYIPNILLNFTDIVSLGLSVGAKAGVEARITHYCQFGGNYGDCYFIEKGYDRRFGGGYDNGYTFQLAALTGEKRYVDKTFGGVKSFIQDTPKAFINSPDDQLYKNNNRDFWAIGVEAGWLINARVDIHPIEIADFVASIFFMDITGDSIK